MKPNHLLALGVFLIGVTAAASPQKAAPAQPTEQQRLKERVDALESQLKEANAKADRAAFEKDRIEDIQKEAKDYYDKAFEQVKWTVGLISLLLAVAQHSA